MDHLGAGNLLHHTSIRTASRETMAQDKAWEAMRTIRGSKFSILLDQQAGTE